MEVLTTKETIKRIEGLAGDAAIDKVAEQFDMEEEIFCEILKRQKPALQAYKKGRTIGVLRAAENLQEQMKTGDIGAIKFFSKLYGIWDNEQQYEIPNKSRSLLPALKILISKNS